MRPYGQRMGTSGREVIGYTCRECPFMTKSQTESREHYLRTDHCMDRIYSSGRGIDVPTQTEATMRRVMEKWLRGI